ncbi:hypothetical protein [Staphylococcus xylosus]|uniref:hypothetical protein n=1 Tax=Staphylococcus xylosus TaxID=1288 RepID=UPI003F55AF69
MRTYANKDELKREILKSFKKYNDEFDEIPNDLKELRIDEVLFKPHMRKWADGATKNAVWEVY